MSKAQLREQWIEFLSTIALPGQQVETVDDDVNLFDTGVLDSLAVIQIIMRLEENHGVDLLSQGVDPSELATIGGILDTIEKISG
jgi:D-alanine--poly(phosphoribitol) ligase subunit 2